jgi:hypothetical protein
MSDEREANRGKAYRFIRAFVLWFALFYAIFFVAYITIGPWLSSW